MDGKFLSDTNEINQPETSNPKTHNSITEIVTNGFFTVDQNWIVKTWNKAAAKLLRVPAGEILGKNLWNTFAGTLPKHFYKAYHESLLKYVPAHFETYWPQMHTSFQAYTFYNGDTLSVSFKSTKTLTTVYPKHELKVLNELYRFITEVTNDCLWEWDINASLIFWIDGGHKRVFGFRIENAFVPQSFWEDHVHPDDKARVLAGLQNIIHESMNPVWEIEYRFRKENGEYAYVHDRAHIIRNASNVAVRMVGSTQDITAKKLSEFQLLRERKTKQREITSAVIKAHENEREGIGNELNNNLNQVLAVTKMYIEMGMSDGKNKDKFLEQSRALVSMVIGEIRRIANALTVPGKYEPGLFDSIRNLVTDLSGKQTVKFEFYTHPVIEKDLSEKLQLCIYRIVQAQTNNIMEHAEATMAVIRLDKKEHKLVLTVSDNGKGCVISETGDGVGIRNIISRAELCDGTTEITSKPGEGFLLKVSFQYP